MYDWVILGLLVLQIVITVFCFWLFFGYFSHINQEISTASNNFQLSNQSIAEAIINLGELLDDLDEVSGELVRPPQIGDIVAQGLQMFMLQKFQGMFPAELTPMFNNQRFSDEETWQEQNVKQQDDQSIREPLR